MKNLKIEHELEITPPPDKKAEGVVRKVEEFLTPPPYFSYRQRRSEIKDSPNQKSTIDPETTDISNGQVFAFVSWKLPFRLPVTPPEADQEARGLVKLNLQ
jgi:hypothetical protein